MGWSREGLLRVEDGCCMVDGDKVEEIVDRLKSVNV